MADKYDVVVVGAGPVGLALAIELGQRGVSVLLAGRTIAEHRIPKGQNLTNRTSEHFRAWHCLDEIRAARPLPANFPSGGVTAYRSLIGDYWHHASGGVGRGDAVKRLFSDAAERLPQYCTERVLLDRLSHLPSVKILSGWTMETFADHEDHIEVSLSTDGATEVVHTRYLVGCDGSRSSVRTLAGIENTQQNLGSRMVLSIFRSEEFEGIASRFPPSTMLRVMSPELHGHWQFFGRIGPDATWFFHAPIDDAEMGEDAIGALLAGAVGRPFEAEIQHAGFWDLRISIANEYRRGNVFIAGDACHSHPPYGGFGLNSGFEDARNLGWKLAATIEGWGSERLLDSYTLERRPIFERTADLIQSYIDSDRNFMELHDPATDKAAFEAAWSAEAGKGFGVGYLPHYEGSPIVVGSPARSPDIDAPATPAAAAGRHLAPAVLADGSEVADHVGETFLLLALDAADAAGNATRAARELGMPLKIIEDRFNGELAEYGHRLILVRPDGFVAWAGDRLPEDAGPLFLQATGRLDLK